MISSKSTARPLIIERDESMKVIRHENISTDPCTLALAGSSEANKNLMNGLASENLAAILRARRHKIDRCPKERPVETM